MNSFEFVCSLSLSHLAVVEVAVVVVDDFVVLSSEGILWQSRNENQSEPAHFSPSKTGLLSLNLGLGFGLSIATVGDLGPSLFAGIQ